MPGTGALAPRKIFSLGLTYRDHLAEIGEKMSPDGPAVFMRDPTSLTRGDQVAMPSRAAVAEALERIERGLGDELVERQPDFPILFDYEVELGVVLLDDFAGEEACPRLGFFLANDITVRTVQILGEGARDRMAFWSASKSFPRTLLVGDLLFVPELAELDEWPQLLLSMRVNGEERQRSGTEQILYSPRQMLRVAAREGGALAAGDVLLTGTPGGIALAVPRWKRRIAELVLTRFGKLAAAFRAHRNNPRFMSVGDMLEMDGGPELGQKTARVVAA